MSVQTAKLAPLGRATDGRPTSERPVFEVGINERLPAGATLLLAVQHILGMTGMLVFPGILGRSFQMSPAETAYLYGMTFLTCGIITLLQSVVLLRLPIVQGPYAGTFAALLAIGHLPGGVGTAFASMAVAALFWCVLSIPLRRFSAVGFLARYISAPIISGTILLLIMMQVANVTMASWLGAPTSPGFPNVNAFAGLVAVGVVIAVLVSGGTYVRRGAILVGLVVGTVVYALFEAVPLTAVASAPWLALPRLFPFGFGVDAEFVAIFFIALMPSMIGSMALYHAVAAWGPEKLTAVRTSQGILAMATGAVFAGVVGGVSTIAYPDNIGVLRATRVGSRYVTAAAGGLLIVLGSVVKFDMLLVAIPLPVLSAVATLMFGIVFMHGIHMLAQVDWDDTNLIVAGLPFFLSVGGLFLPPDTLAHLPLAARIILGQPLILGSVLLILLHVALNLARGRSSAGEMTGHSA